MAERTLEAMAKGGIFDHIGGGFSRYSTDERWLIPHFEKMLYDNALLILAYLEAYRITGKEIYGDTVRRTADYILRELTDEVGGFYCGQDADSDGVEGRYYALTPEEVEAVLGKEDGDAFCLRYGITGEGNFEGKSIPNRIRASGEGQAAEPPIRRRRSDEDGHQEACLQKLYRYRKERTSLHKDDKILLSWNAWTMTALARAGRILAKERYLEAAERAARFVETYMSGEDGRLYLRFREGELGCKGQLEDYAVYVLALLAMTEAVYPHRELLCTVSGGLSESLIRQFKDMPAHGLDILVKTAENEDALARCVPFTADYPLPREGERYYLCENGACRTPAETWGEIEEILGTRRS